MLLPVLPLQWSQRLNFDEYVDDWTSMACTLGSQAFLVEDEGTFLKQLEAYESSVMIHSSPAASNPPVFITVQDACAAVGTCHPPYTLEAALSTAAVSSRFD